MLYLVNFLNGNILKGNNMFRIFIILFLIPIVLQSKVISVGLNSSGYDFNNLTDAANEAVPGDTILIAEGEYPGREYISELHGSEENKIVIKSEFGAYVLFVGGTNAIHFVNVSHLIIEGLRFNGQTGNGVNIDDGGDYSTPTHNILFENCEWLGMNANDNNDELKMSGVDDFVIRNCKFYNGSQGGSLIDMVGCHKGIVEQCHFENGGSNSIQMKGGTEHITIRRNSFLNGGLRALNIGGGTGSAYFRPIGAKFESARILVHSNTISGSQAAIGFVGTVESKVINNTIYIPEKWAVRILQENTGEGMLVCSDNEFSNNIVFIDERASVYTFNIGPNTDPESFIFKNNLWYNWRDPDWDNPNLPAIEDNGIYAKDPLFEFESFYLKENSPAIGAGYNAGIEFDYKGKEFAAPPSIGAIEGAIQTSVNEPIILEHSIYICPNPAENTIEIISYENINNAVIRIYDVSGQAMTDRIRYISGKNISISSLPPGIYLIKINLENKIISRIFFKI